MPIKGFVQLKGKMYTFTTEDNDKYEKEKVINKNFELKMMK